MEHLVIDGTKYKVPSHVIEVNSKAEDMYSELFLSEVISGQEDFDRLDNDFLDSELFGVYAEFHGIEEGDANINDVRESLFAVYTNYDEDDFDTFLLEEIKD